MALLMMAAAVASVATATPVTAPGAAAEPLQDARRLPQSYVDQLPIVSDPLAPARAGKLMCITPIMDEKLCLVINRYSFEADGRIQIHAEAMLLPDRAVNVKFETPVVMRGDQACSKFTAFQGGKLYEKGQPADEKLTTELFAYLAERSEMFGDKEACTLYRAEQGTYVAVTTVENVQTVYQPERVIWVDPLDGWAVKPSVRRLDPAKKKFERPAS